MRRFASSASSAWRANVVVAIVLAGTAVPGDAQSIDVGIKGGFNASTIAWSPTPLGSGLDELERRRSFAGGLVLAIAGPGRFRLRGEILHSSKGYTEIENDGDRLGIAVDYLEIPVLFGFALPVGSHRVVPELYAGPWMSWKTRCNASLEVATTAVSFDCNEVPGDPILRKTTDWGVAVGAGLTFPTLGRLKGMMDVRYTAGLRNLDAQADIDNVNVRHRSYGITLGLLIPVGG